jgi:hypothetical protein
MYSVTVLAHSQEPAALTFVTGASDINCLGQSPFRCWGVATCLAGWSHYHRTFPRGWAAGYRFPTPGLYDRNFQSGHKKCQVFI